MISLISTQLARVRERMATAATHASRDPSEITLVAVTKTHPWAFVQAALAAGQLDFGENRPEEAFAKFIAPHLPPPPSPPLASPPPASLPPASLPPRLHLIGPIQSRKAEIALACRPVLIHSIDRLKIARKISDLAQAQGRSIDVLFEVNVSGEATKSGFSAHDLRAALPDLVSLPGLRSHGLMTIPPFDPDPETARPYFAALRHLRDDLATAYPQADWSQLSIGMSHDFEVAIEEGATLVRVGSAIFGPRL